MQVVEDGSAILFSRAALVDQDNVQTISWSQSLEIKTESFVQLMATFASDMSSLVLFFVQQSQAEKLLSASNPITEGGDQYKVVVQPPMFRYGQDNSVESTLRFLVFLDPSYNIYQRYFLNESTVSKLDALAKGEPNVVPFASAAKNLMDSEQSVPGDPLHTFE